MVKIEKTQEPDSWTQYRTTPGTDYSPSDDLRASLLKEQGYICAYCMRRIPVTDPGTSDTSRIEHIVPRSVLPTPQERMDYGNMVICCPGAMQSPAEKHTHCDRHKKENPIQITPLKQNCIDTILYKTDGTILSTHPKYNQELNEQLNLNVYLLKENRRRLLSELAVALERAGKKASKNKEAAMAPKSFVERLLKSYIDRDSEYKRKEYCGVAIYYLTKKLRQYT